MSTNLQSHVWGELYWMGLKLSYQKGVLRFHFVDMATGKVAYTIACDLRTQKGRFVADEISWSHAFPEELWNRVQLYIKRWAHDQ
jgi:hypothetical protein